MTTHRVVFMPFRRDQVGDFIDEAKAAEKLGAAGKAHHARKFEVVCWDDAGSPMKKYGFASGHRIMIAGHGLAGRPYISNSGGQGQKEYVPYNVAVDRMIDAGLNKKYTGTISTDVCYSAVNNDTNPAFADLVARYLRKKGYRLCHTMGYLGPLGAVPESMQGEHKFRHRVVDLMNDDGSVAETVKSKDAKKRYWGTQTIPRHLEGLSAANNVCPTW